MTDRELLELAARATGIKIHSFQSGKINGTIDGLKNFHWNPLTDDGDALRLAVKLDFEVTQGDDEGPCAWVNYFMTGSVRWLSLSEQHTKKRNKATEAEKQAATRRAIVRAAAEIGKAMP